MRCVFCKCDETFVIDSRKKLGRIQRRHECVECNRRFNTIEIAVNEYNALIDEVAGLKKLIKAIQNVLTTEERQL